MEACVCICSLGMTLMYWGFLLFYLYVKKLPEWSFLCILQITWTHNLKDRFRQRSRVVCCIAIYFCVRCHWLLSLFLTAFSVFCFQSAFFHQHGCTTNDTNAKYNSRAAQLYKEKIKSLATQATRKHGTDVSSVCPEAWRFLKNITFFPCKVTLNF